MIFVILHLLIAYMLFSSSKLPVQSLPTESLVTNAVPTQKPTPSPAPTHLPLPSSFKLKGGTHTFQTFNNCGPAALSMALSHYLIDKSQNELGQRLRPYQHPQGINDDKSVTLAELAEFTKELGFIPYHRPAGDISLIKRALSQDIPVITRTLLESDSDIGHFRIVTGYDDVKTVLAQDDSLQGSNLEYSYSAFNDLWRAFNYEFLILLPPEKNHLAPTILENLFDPQTSWQQALNLSQQALTKNPADIYAGFNQSVALYHLGEYQNSINIFESVRYRLPARMLWYQLEPLLAYYTTGQYEQVLTLSQEILNADNPAYSELHYLQGKIHEIRGNVAKANESFRLAHTYNHNTGFWRVNVK